MHKIHHIIGAGGVGKEIASSMQRDGSVIRFIDDKMEGTVLGVSIQGGVKTLNEIQDLNVIIAIADCHIRKKIWESLPDDVKRFTHISNHSTIMNPEFF